MMGRILWDPEAERRESVRTVRGVVLAVALGAVLWGLLAVAGLMAARWLV